MIWLAGGGGVQIALLALALLLGFLLAERFMAVETGIRITQEGARPAVRSAHSVQGYRRLGIIRACIVTAPLLGLLGTVTGMVETFDSVLTGGYLQEMSKGISKALLTTQYGLAIAVPALVFERLLLRRSRKLAALGAGNDEVRSLCDAEC